MIKARRRALSLIIAVLMAFTGIIPAMSAFAADGVQGYYDIELFYKDTDTIVPTYADGSEEETYVEYMKEGEKLNLTYKLIDTEMPKNGRINWYSEEPTLVDVDQNGVVKAFDSSKGAVIQKWIDNEVKTIPLVGNLMGQAIEKVLFNEYVDVDTMDTEAIINLVEGAFGSNSLLAKWADSYKGQLVDSLRGYLDHINSNIHVQLIDADGTVLDDDSIHITVLKNDAWYANFLPNGTHITNKATVNTTVAVGSTCQLYAVTTPLRLHYKTQWSIKSSSIFSQGKVVATVNDSGLVTFKNTGTVTVLASPDTEEIIEGILKLVNYVYALDNTGTLDTDKIAGILIDYIGIDMNRAVLAGLLDIAFAIKDIAGDAADPVQLTATAVEIISNLVLQFIYNDSITFTVVDSQPLTDFAIDGADTVKEGSQIQLTVKDIQPSAGDTTDIEWRSSDPSIASVDPVTGVVTGRDAGGSLGNLSSQKCTIYAVSKANNIERSMTLTVTGKTGKYLSDVDIMGKDYLEIGEDEDFSYAVYPKRVAESDNLYISWGVLSGENEDGSPIYTWATDDAPAQNEFGSIDKMGHYTIIQGGECVIALNARTGYYLSNGNFYEISSFTKTFTVTNGIPIENIQINVIDGTSNGDLNRVNNVNVEGTDYTYATIHKGVLEAYAGNGAKFTAEVYPENASNKNIRWVCDNGYYSPSISDDTHSASFKQKAAHEVADTFNVYAESLDGTIRSNTITVCVTRNFVTGNTIDQDQIDVVRGKKADATHTLTFDGSWDGTAYACYKCNWYSSDESIFTVKTKNNDNRDATITAVDVGTATLYCVSADGGIVDTCQVTVYPDKTYLQNIVNLCDKTVIKRTAENRSLYNKYMNKLDLAYYILYDEPMASQTTCDTYADELLYAFYKLGGFVGIVGVDILGPKETPLESEYVTVEVASMGNYRSYSYDFDYQIKPKNAMYSDIVWTSSSDAIEVDKNGVCKPKSNDPCSAMITCTVKDYMGGEISSHAFISFVKTRATGVTLDTNNIAGGKIGETQTLKATVLPNNTFDKASVNTVYWSSSDDSIASVDQNGVVTFKEGGYCTIYATSYDGGFVAECSVEVVTNYSALELLVQQYTDLQLNPVNYFPESWEYFSAEMDKARVMLNKRTYGQKEVDAMTAELEQAYNSLQKYNYIQKIELYLDGEQAKEFYQYDLSLLSEGISYKNAVLDLNVRLYPNNGSYEKVIWQSSTTDISVTSDGKCSPTINSSCYGMITCTVFDHYGNSFTDSVWVSYSYTPVTGMALSESAISGAIGETHQLSCTVQPTGTSLLHVGAASIKDYYWESADESIATVDQTGLVTFVSAGATVIRAVSYDGGITGECVVSTDGDRSALLKAVDDYKDIVYTDYEYSYGMAFKQAYEDAEAAMNNNTLTQERIDQTANALNNAASALAGHEYVKATDATITYQTYKKSLIGSASKVTSGTVGSSNALSLNISDTKTYSNYNNYNYVTLTADAAPSNAMYKSIEWRVESSSHMSNSISNNSITLTPKEQKDAGIATVSAIITDDYDRTFVRTITVVITDNTCTGFDITDQASSYYATAQPVQLAYTLSGDPEIKTVLWSSSNENVCRVDENGVVSFVDKGEAVITGKTYDGGYTDTIKITVQTDFSQLAAKQVEYYNLIQESRDHYVYTDESLDNLAVYVADAQTMINDGRATQAEVNQMLVDLENAYTSLAEYIPVTSVSLTAEEDNNVTIVKDGYVRYTGTLLNGKQVVLKPVFNDPNAIYTDIKWESSSSVITVDENGFVTTGNGQAQAARITCTVTNVFGGECSASIYVAFVRYGVVSVDFDSDMVFGAPAQTVQLEPVITNTNKTNIPSTTCKTCDYISSNPEIATVDSNGVVTFISQGEATITAITHDGGFEATIVAYTTWDTTALKAAIDDASKLDYKDYAYDYGMELKSSLEAARDVYANVYASQSEIDEACLALTEAMSALEGNEFIKPELSLTLNDVALKTSDIVEVDPDTNQATVSLTLNDGAMVKSTSVTVDSAYGAAATASGNDVLLTKTSDKGTVVITVSAVDDYDREYTSTFTLSVIDELVSATAIDLYADGQLVGAKLTKSCGGTYTNFKGIQLSYVPTPANANAIMSVSYKSSATTYVTVDANGMINLTTAGKIRSSNTATITCTVTNADGTTATSSFALTITRA